jgi:indole-3-glycerol phosphate synthase
MPVSTILDHIVASKRQEVEEARRRVSERNLECGLEGALAPRDFRAALEGARGMQVIAEVKKVSPSAGVIRAQTASLRFPAGSAFRIVRPSGRSCCFGQ